MATVYLADDLKHERKVTLKVLKPELAAVVGAEHSLAEIETTADTGPLSDVDLVRSPAVQGGLHGTPTQVIHRQKRLFAALLGSAGPDCNGPGEGNRRRIVANLVVAGLIVERASECQLVVPTQRGYGIPRAFENHFLQQGERSLVNRHTLVQRFK